MVIDSFTHTEYKFSKKATRYSYLLALTKRWPIQTLRWFFVFLALYALFSSLFSLNERSNNYDAFMLACAVTAVYITIQIKKIFVEHWKNKLVRELELEAQKASTSNPRLASAIRERMIPEVTMEAKAKNKAH